MGSNDFETTEVHRRDMLSQAHMSSCPSALQERHEEYLSRIENKLNKVISVIEVEKTKTALHGKVIFGVAAAVGMGVLAAAGSVLVWGLSHIGVKGP